MGFSFKREGYIEQGKERITSVSLDIGGYSDGEFVSAVYHDRTKAIEKAEAKIGSFKPVSKKFIVPETEEQPKMVTEEDEEEEYKAWYSVFINWMRKVFY